MVLKRPEISSSAENRIEWGEPCLGISFVFWLLDRLVEWEVIQRWMVDGDQWKSDCYIVMRYDYDDGGHYEDSYGAMVA